MPPAALPTALPDMWNDSFNVAKSLMSKLLNICGCCMSFQLFSFRVQARCRQHWQQCPGLLRSPCGSEGCGVRMGCGWLGMAGEEPARDPAGENLWGRSHFTGKITLIPMKTLPRSQRPPEARWDRSNLAANLNSLLGFHTHIFHCSSDLLLRQWGCSRGSQGVLIPKAWCEWHPGAPVPPHPLLQPLVPWSPAAAAVGAHHCVELHQDAGS